MDPTERGRPVNENSSPTDTNSRRVKIVKAGDDRHELWDELEAFDPKWQMHYDTTEDAAIAANVHGLWHDYCRDRRYARSMACQPRQVPDTAGVVRREQQTAASTSLPYRLDTIGTVRQVEE